MSSVQGSGTKPRKNRPRAGNWPEKKPQLFSGQSGMVVLLSVHIRNIFLLNSYTQKTKRMFFFYRTEKGHKKLSHRSPYIDIIDVGT